jgi:hypothetical protein
VDPLTTAAIALGTIIATKIAEKTTENATQVVWDQSAKFLQSLKQESPEIATAIEKAPEQPLDYAPVVVQMARSCLPAPSCTGDGSPGQ